MIVTYLTDDNVLVSVCHVGSGRKGQAKWQVRVEGMGGAAQWSVKDLPASPGWSAERVARLALEWAQALPDAPGCPCGQPDCEAPVFKALDVFGPTSPMQVKLQGPYFDRDEAAVAAAVQAGYLDEDEAEEQVDADKPTIEEMLAELDGKPLPKRSSKKDPPDPFNGSTWRLG